MPDESSSPVVADADALCRLLEAQSVPYTRVDHPPVFTCDEASRFVPGELGGVHTKNLFLRDGKGRQHWLLVTHCEKAVDLKALAATLDTDKLSLASPDRLLRHLGLTPGAVTVLGLVNDPLHLVSLLVDRDIWGAESWQCHPLVNTATLRIERDGLDRFLRATGHVPLVVEVAAR